MTRDGERDWLIENLSKNREESDREKLRAEVVELRAELARRDRLDGTRDAELRALARSAGGARCN